MPVFRSKKPRITYERLNMVDGDGNRIWWMDHEKNTNHDDDDVIRMNWNMGRNWLDMPDKVIILIFIKLGTVWVLGVAQHVCKLWRKLSKQPIIYRSVAIHDRDVDPFYAIFNNRISVGGLARLAFERGSGQTLQFSCSSMWYFAHKHLELIADNKSYSALKSLRLGEGGEPEMASVIKKFTSLEELYLFEAWEISEDVIVEIGQACSKLEYLRIGNLDFSGDGRMAFVIAENMPGLRRLHLRGEALTVKGFQAILNGCPRLQYLRLNADPNLLDVPDVDCGSLKKQFSRIKNIGILNRSDYEFDLEATLELSLTKVYSDAVWAPFQDEVDIEAYYRA